MKLKYTGHKKQIPVNLPIGATKRSLIERTIFADPYIVLSDEDAAALMAIDNNFEIVTADLDTGTEIHTDAEAKKKGGRPKKEPLNA